MKNNVKIELDKYYTPTNIAEYCIAKTFEVLADYNITDIVEPSAGAGAFSNILSDCTAMDISPDGPGIIQQDFLLWRERYKRGRLFIGNPPFGGGEADNLAIKFYNKACLLGDFIAWILPLGYYNNQGRMSKFKLIHSEDLGLVEYSGTHKVPTCFNIYKRPSPDEAGDRRIKQITFRDIDITYINRVNVNGVLVLQNKPKTDDYDFKLIVWGSTRLIEKDYWFSGQALIYIKNKDVYEGVKSALMIIHNNTVEQNRALFNSVNVCYITKYKLSQFLLDNVPGLK